jgi:hypothetical protein
MLPDVIPLSPGIGLLAAGNDPAGDRAPAPLSRRPDIVD